MTDNCTQEIGRQAERRAQQNLWGSVSKDVFGLTMFNLPPPMLMEVYRTVRIDCLRPVRAGIEAAL